MTLVNLKYKRVLLKLSGEVLRADADGVIDAATMIDIATRMKELQDMGVELGVVVGGGNIWRYRDNQAGDGFKFELDRVTSDTMGMLATVMNSLALEGALKNVGADVRAMSCFPAEKAMETYVPKRALSHMSKGRIVIFAGGTGSPFFTTDSAAALRALEMKCDVLLKATKVDYVYDKDPVKHSDAKKYLSMQYDEVIEKKLAVMDLTCAALLNEGGVPMLVFNFNNSTNMRDAVMGKEVGTLIT